MKKMWLFLISACVVTNVFTQPQLPWNGKKCAVVLTYDDAIVQHLQNAVPLLDSLHLKASFYITASSPGCSQHIDEWRKVAAEGHELGNHTLYHPCIGNLPGREWVKPDYDMSRYTVARMVDEIKMTNVFLEALDGKKERTFAFTCGDMLINDTPFINLVKPGFIAARSTRGQLHKINEVKLLDVDCFVVNNNTAAEMIEWVKKARETNSLLVILFHGVGGGNSLNVSLEEHRKFLVYLKQQEKDSWIAPMMTVAKYIKLTQANN
ncbi:polysaccharide deacetylase family protein [soil metagenome]